MPDMSGKQIYLYLKRMNPCEEVLLTIGLSNENQAKEIMA
jgi:hypothetical protein